MKLELRRPRAISSGPKVPASPRLFAAQQQVSLHIARRIIAISKDGDQARSIAELMK